VITRAQVIDDYSSSRVAHPEGRPAGAPQTAIAQAGTGRNGSAVRWSFAVAAVLTVAIGCSKPAGAPAPHSAPTGSALSVAWAPGFHEQTVEANGQRIHLVVGGKGPPILLIHGWPETAYEWRKMLPELAKDHTLYAVDLRGAGQSSVPESGYDKQTLAEDVYAAMLKLGVAKAEVVGHDWGASVAYAYAARHPEAVGHLLVCEGAPFGPWMPKTDLFWYFGFMRIPGFAERVIVGNEREYLR